MYPARTRIELLSTMDDQQGVNFYYKAIDEKSLGEYVAKHKEDASDEILPFINTEKLGTEYHDDFEVKSSRR